MPQVKFTRHLVRFFPQLSGSAPVEAQGDTVRELIADLERQYPGMAAYLVDDHGRLRKHVNIFVGRELILDREKLTDPLAEIDQVFVYQALSGG